MKYLYHSSDVGNLKYLTPHREQLFGVAKRRKGVWATNDKILSRAFGISLQKIFRKKQGKASFSLNGNRRILLSGVRLSQIPKNFVAYTYYLDPKEFKKIDGWQYFSAKRARIIKMEPYNLRKELLKHFEIYEKVG